jgi:hypothetical protein
MPAVRRRRFRIREHRTDGMPGLRTPGQADARHISARRTLRCALALPLLRTSPGPAGVDRCEFCGAGRDWR